ncbi:MAG: hypothetical protein LBN42_00590 [Oscillospiraceae bacterium]|jgi:hypothetical protein|nr:hypothetical protein [Oscillospiraceae bacterium]
MKRTATIILLCAALILTACDKSANNGNNGTPDGDITIPLNSEFTDYAPTGTNITAQTAPNDSPTGSDNTTRTVQTADISETPDDGYTPPVSRTQVHIDSNICEDYRDLGGGAFEIHLPLTAEQFGAFDNTDPYDTAKQFWNSAKSALDINAVITQSDSDVYTRAFDLFAARRKYEELFAALGNITVKTGSVTYTTDGNYDIEYEGDYSDGQTPLAVKTGGVTAVYWNTINFPYPSAKDFKSAIKDTFVNGTATGTRVKINGVWFDRFIDYNGTVYICDANDIAAAADETKTTAIPKTLLITDVSETEVTGYYIYLSNNKSDADNPGADSAHDENCWVFEPFKLEPNADDNWTLLE